MKRTHLINLPAWFLYAVLVPAANNAQAAQTISYLMKVQRATQAVIWAMPAVSVYDIEYSIQRD